MQKIGIIVAMEEEEEEIVRILENIEYKQIYNLDFKIGTINDKECVLVRSGVGKVNAARTTQILIDNFEVACVFNLGSAGAINDMLEIGDVVIGEHVVQHDFDITAFGHSKGYITGVGNNVICDRDLVEKFRKLIENNEERTYNVKLGVVATGDVFCTDTSMKDEIRANFDADLVDMECGAIAQVCYLDNVPFVVVRSVSDSPNGKNVSTFEENLQLASRRAAIILKEFLK